MNIQEELFLIHVKIYEELIKKGSNRKLHFFNYICQGHIGIGEIEGKNWNLENITEYKIKLELLFKDSSTSESILEGIHFYFYLSFLTNPVNPYIQFIEFSKKHIQEISGWHQNSLETFLCIGIIPEIHTENTMEISGWEKKQLSLAELSYKSMTKLESAQEGCERVFGTTWLKKPTGNFMNQTKEEYYYEIDILLLALWKGTGKIHKLQEVYFEHTPWNFCPYKDKNIFGYQNQFSDNTRREFHKEFYLQDFNNPASFMQDFNKDLTSKWFDWININRENIFMLSSILNGFDKITDARVGIEHIKEKKLLEGIYDIIAGLEGLSQKDNSNSGEICKQFKNFWYEISKESEIWKRYNSLNNKTKIKELLHELYDLRSRISHSNTSEIKIKIGTISKKLGELNSNLENISFHIMSIAKGLTDCLIE